MIIPPTPFALGLSKGYPSLSEREEGQGFDRLSPNGVVFQELVFAGGRA
jgi:hypothetical protein